jgi:hypothetical protein
MKNNNQFDLIKWIFVEKRTYSIVITFILIAIALYVSPSIIILHKVFLLISASVVYSCTAIKWIEGDKRYVDILDFQYSNCCLLRFL